jgi:hypothetical protein
MASEFVCLATLFLGVNVVFVVAQESSLPLSVYYSVTLEDNDGALASGLS